MLLSGVRVAPSLKLIHASEGAAEPLQTQSATVPDGVDGKVSAIDQAKASCSLLVARNAEARSERWIDSPGYVGLELRLVQRPELLEIGNRGCV
jgi:hypothetical protein